MAQPTLTVYAYGNVDALHGILNAVAMVMGADDFADMIRVAVLIGFLVVAVVAVNPQNLHRSWNWFMCVAVLSGVLLTPKATVTIEDKLGQQPPVVVANVPWVLAVMATVKSSIGATLTGLFETAFQTIPNNDRALPAELGYLEHGVMFGNRLIRSSREADFNALNAQGDTLNYLRNCIFPSLGRESNPGAFERSTALIDEISDPNPALFSTYHDTANGGILVSAPCDKVFTQVERGLNSAGSNALRTMGARLLPQLPVDEAQAKVSDSLVSVYGKTALANAGATAQDIMIQNILINATADASALYAASLDDPAVLMFASMRSQAVGSMNAGYLVQGRIAEEALPVIRNITEAILYAVFPVLCILAIASEGRALMALAKGYMYALIWVELWPPMFAVVNYLQTLASVANLQAAGTMPSTLGLTLQTATGVYSTAVSDVAVASWMVTFVPVLAGAVLFGMDRIMSITGSRPGSSQSEAEASQGSKGNVNMGNATFERQQLDAYRSEPMMYTQAGVGGETVIDRLSGAARYRHSQSSGPVSVSDVASLAREQGQSASHSFDLAQSEAKQADSSLQSAIGRIDSLARSGAYGKDGSEAWSRSREAVDAEDAKDASSVAEKLASRFGASDRVNVAKAIGAGLSTPLIVEALGLSAKAGTTSDVISDATRMVDEERSGLRDRSASRAIRSAEQFSSQAQYREGHASDVRATEDARAELRQASSYREASSSHFSEGRQYQDSERKLSALQHSWTISNANAFYEFAAREGKHPGNASISRQQWADTLQRFLSFGEVGRDDDGDFFMPQVGQGPNIMQGADSTRPDSLRAAHERFTPAGGEAQVSADAMKRSHDVLTKQRRAGVLPDSSVDGNQLKGSVAADQERVGERIRSSKGAIDGGQSRIQSETDVGFRDAPGQAGDSFVRVLAAPDSEGKGGNSAVEVNLSRPRPAKDVLEAELEKAKTRNSEIPTK